MRNRHQKTHKHISRKEIKVLKIVLIAIFLFLAYQYYTKNIIDAFFTSLIRLPLFSKVVEGWIYWVIVGVICFGIWKVVDYFK